jgi:2-alkenal reductase
MRMNLERARIDDLPTTSREVRLRTRPRGLPDPEDFEVVATPVRAPGPGEVLVRNLVFRVSASVRMMIAVGAETVDGVPFPPLQPGDTLAEAALGEILVAPPGGAFARGDLVLHHRGFREIAIVPLAELEAAGGALPDPAAHLAQGWTAYAALHHGARLQRGETVFVSSAAGAIGSMAAMIARDLGAARVVGSTSTRAKGARLCSELGYDAAVVREDGPLLPQLRAAAPDGLDVVIDNVGGETLTAAVRAARTHARIVVLGALSGQLAPEGTGRTAPAELDSFPILLKRLTLRGYSADDDPAARDEFTRIFAEGLRTGTMSFPHTRIRGIERVPETICDAMRGRFFGSVLVEL